MAQVDIYSSMFCPFCSRAKHLLSLKGVDFIEIDVDTSPGKRNEMLDRANGQHHAGADRGDPRQPQPQRPARRHLPH